MLHREGAAGHQAEEAERAENIGLYIRIPITMPIPERSDIEVIVAGHICVDIIPRIDSADSLLDFRPGHLLTVGPPVISPGGVVSNTGIALYRMGIGTRLVGKLGDDSLGRMLIRIFEDIDPRLASDLIVSGRDATSYTVVVSPPGRDRMFLHHPGANHTFDGSEIASQMFTGVKAFHFGYPPLMRRMMVQDGKNLVSLFRRIRKAGLAVSLDMCRVDPRSEAGNVDWKTWLGAVLPHVDLFFPSYDDLDSARIMPSPLYPAPLKDMRALQDMASLLLSMGPGMVGIKLGEHGIYLRTAREKKKLHFLLRFGYDDIGAWSGIELYTPCYRTIVQGTTGSGDCAHAGLIAALIRHQDPEDALNTAAAVGALSVGGKDATIGIPGWKTIQEKLSRGWKKNRLPFLAGWNRDSRSGLLKAPHVVGNP